MPEVTHTVPARSAEERLDVWLAAKLKLTRSQVQHLIRDGLVHIDGELPKKTGDRLRAGTVVVVQTTRVPVLEKIPGPESSSIDLFSHIKIVADTPDYLVVDKPTGLIVHPPTTITRKIDIAKSPTLAGWILQRYPKLWGVGEYANRPGMPHRLDKDTSGLMVIAKRQKMFDVLKQQFKDRNIEKHYYALVHGVIERDHGSLDFVIDRGVSGRMVARPKVKEVTLRTVTMLPEGRTALTEFTVEKRFINFTLVNVRLHTGRTHQIRVHMFAFTHPVVGDTLYFNKKLKRDKDKELGRLFLHSYRLCFFDLAGEKVCFESEMPGTLSKFLEKLK